MLTVPSEEIRSIESSRQAPSQPERKGSGSRCSWGSRWLVNMPGTEEYATFGGPWACALSLVVVQKATGGPSMRKLVC